MRGGMKDERTPTCCTVINKSRKLIASCSRAFHLRAFHAETARIDCPAESVPLVHREPRRAESRSQREHGRMLAACAGAPALALGGRPVAVSAARGWRAAGREFPGDRARAGVAHQWNG